jgi:hypothetical protein
MLRISDENFGKTLNRCHTAEQHYDPSPPCISTFGPEEILGSPDLWTVTTHQKMITAEVT